MKKLASLFVALFSLVWLTGAGWLPLAKSSTTNFLLINTGSTLLINAGSKFKIQ